MRKSLTMTMDPEEGMFSGSGGEAMSKVRRRMRESDPSSSDGGSTSDGPRMRGVTGNTIPNEKRGYVAANDKRGKVAPANEKVPLDALQIPTPANSDEGQQRVGRNKASVALTPVKSRPRRTADVIDALKKAHNLDSSARVALHRVDAGTSAADTTVVTATPDGVRVTRQVTANRRKKRTTLAYNTTTQKKRDEAKRRQNKSLNERKSRDVTRDIYEFSRLSGDSEDEVEIEFPKLSSSENISVKPGAKTMKNPGGRKTAATKDAKKQTTSKNGRGKNVTSADPVATRGRLASETESCDSEFEVVLVSKRPNRAAMRDVMATDAMATTAATHSTTSKGAKAKQAKNNQSKTWKTKNIDDISDDGGDVRTRADDVTEKARTNKPSSRAATRRAGAAVKIRETEPEEGETGSKGSGRVTKVRTRQQQQQQQKSQKQQQQRTEKNTASRLKPDKRKWTGGDGSESEAEDTRKKSGSGQTNTRAGTIPETEVVVDTESAERRPVRRVIVHPVDVERPARKQPAAQKPATEKPAPQKPEARRGRGRPRKQVATETEEDSEHETEDDDENTRKKPKRSRKRHRAQIESSQSETETDSAEPSKKASRTEKNCSKPSKPSKSQTSKSRRNPAGEDDSDYCPVEYAKPQPEKTTAKPKNAKASKEKAGRSKKGTGTGAEPAKGTRAEPVEPTIAELLERGTEAQKRAGPEGRGGAGGEESDEENNAPVWADDEIQRLKR